MVVAFFAGNHRVAICGGDVILVKGRLQTVSSPHLLSTWACSLNIEVSPQWREGCMCCQLTFCGNKAILVEDSFS